MTNKLYDIIIEPIITEKSLANAENSVYTFKVAKTANKVEIKNAIQTIFDVKVETVRTVTVLPKKKRVGRYTGTKAGYKKAIVTLKDGNSISQFSI